MVSGCYSDSCSDGTLFKIAKGNHYSTPRLVEFLRSDALNFQVKFDSTAIYNSDGDLNKLYGFADCNSQHHQASARIGWRWIENQLELWAYSYASGIRTMEYITSIPLDTWINCKITKLDKEYEICANGICIKTLRQNKCNTGVYYILYPYFGGDLPAPHDVYVWIK